MTHECCRCGRMFDTLDEKTWHDCEPSFDEKCWPVILTLLGGALIIGALLLRKL